MRPIDADALLARAIKERRFVVATKDLINPEITIRTAYKDLYEFIKQAPTLTVDDLLPKERAMWIPYYNGGIDRREYRCSKCWNGAPTNQASRCPGCGSEMLPEL